MGPFEMVVAIVAIVIIGGIIKEAVKKRKTESTEIENLKGRLKQLDTLETRIQTLETIVTDRKSELKREIDAL